MNKLDFKRFKKVTIYPTVSAVRKEITQKSIKCVSDTTDSVYYELGEYDPKIHCRTGVPSFHLDYQSDCIKLTVNENLRMTIPIKDATTDWLKAELYQWLSYEICKKRCSHKKPSFPYTLRLAEQPKKHA